MIMMVAAGYAIDQNDRDWGVGTTTLKLKTVYIIISNTGFVWVRDEAYYAAVLIGRITGLVRLSVCLYVRLSRMGI